MRQKEQRLWDRMRNNRPADVLLQRIENMLEDGFPDVIGKHRENRMPLPIELKAVHTFPARASSRVFGDDGLRIGQRNWLMEWSQFNGLSLIVCSVGEQAAALHWAIDGTYYDQFNDMTRADLDRTAYFTGRGAQFWPALWQLMRDFQ